jgi:hypothetical protein
MILAGWGTRDRKTSDNNNSAKLRGKEATELRFVEGSHAYQADTLAQTIYHSTVIKITMQGVSASEMLLISFAVLVKV